MLLNHIRLILVVSALLFSLCAVAAEEYMPPEKISWLAPSLVKELKDEGCKIPRNIDNYFTSGVIVGQFASRGQIDIAVLCVTDKNSFIKIVWGGNKKCPSRLASTGQSITAVDGYYIWERYEAYGGKKPPDEIMYEAINDHYLGKASVVHYCLKGNWIELTGAD